MTESILIRSGAETLTVPSARDVRAAAAASSARGATPREAADAFEGYLLGAMLRFGARPLAPNLPLSGGSAQRMYRELFYEEVARLAAARGDLGIGRMLAPAASEPTAGGEGGP